jgi:hypothetical protein
MRRLFLILGFLSIGLLVFSISGELTKGSNNFDLKVFKNELRSSDVLKMEPDFGNIPLYFIPNQGQVHKEALFYAKVSRYTLWLTKEELVFESTNEKFERDVSRLQFLNANKKNEVAACEPSEHRVSYFVGNDPSQWQADIPTSRAVLYKDLYENIDLKIYGVEKEIEYDWVVRPGGRAEDVCFAYKDVKGTEIDREGNLVIESKFGELKHRKPLSYQIIDGKKAEVGVRFKAMGKNEYGFVVKEYDPNYDLIIDPLVLVYSTYLGGCSKDYGINVAVDNSGAAYMVGYTYSYDFPTKNPFQKANHGGYDVIVTKLSSSGKSLIYSTYLGGSQNDYGIGITVDNSGAAYVTGYTYSSNFPKKNAYQETKGGNYDAFVTKISPSGTSLIYSTYLGGSGPDYGMDIAVDSSGAAYIIGHTHSSNFPKKNAYQGTKGGDYDAFVTKISPSGTSLEYSTYLGGFSEERGFSIAVDNSGAAYVTGYTESTNFPIKDAYQKAEAGSSDVFVTKLSPKGKSLIYSTYLGGLREEQGFRIAVDNSGAAYITGYTESTNFPIKNAYQSTLLGLGDVFVTKVSSSGNSLVYSTYLGGSDDEWANGIAVDSSGAVYIISTTYSTDFPVKNAYQKNNRGKNDVAITELSSSGTSLLYSTYLGGSDFEFGYGLAADSSRAVYVTGDTYSTDFPTKNAFQKTFGRGYTDAFVTKFSFSSKPTNF